MQTEAAQASVKLRLPGWRQRPTEEAESPRPLPPVARLPRITRLMALAIKLQHMVDRGEVRDYADIARLGYVSRARVTHIMNLLLLAPDIQEGILFLPDSPLQSCRITEHEVRDVSKLVLWKRQRAAWREIVDARAQRPAA